MDLSMLLQKMENYIINDGVKQLMLLMHILACLALCV